MTKPESMFPFFQLISVIALESSTAFTTGSPIKAVSKMIRFGANNTVCESLDCVPDVHVLCRVKDVATNSSKGVVSCKTGRLNRERNFELINVKCPKGKIGDSCRLHYRVRPRLIVRGKEDAKNLVRVVMFLINCFVIAFCCMSCNTFCRPRKTEIVVVRVDADASIPSPSPPSCR